MDADCEHEGDQYTDERDCFNSGSLAPIVMNSVNGLKYCGVRNEISLMEMVRPIRISEYESEGR